MNTELIPIPQRADLFSLVEVLLGWSAFSSKEGILWVDGTQLIFGAWHDDHGKRSSDALERIFETSLGDLRWRWRGSLDELHVWVADKRYRVKFQGGSEMSAAIGDAAASIELPALKMAAIADQIMQHHRLKNTWHQWKPVLEAASASTG